MEPVYAPGVALLGSTVTVIGVGATPEAGLMLSHGAEDADVEAVKASPAGPVWIM